MQYVKELDHERNRSFSGDGNRLRAASGNVRRAIHANLRPHHAPGASIVLDGEELGKSDGLFLVPPGVRKITLEMDGYDPETKSLDVKQGWITRVEVEMVRKGELPSNETRHAEAAPAEAETIHNVRWVIADDDKMTFEAESVTLDELPSRLEKVPNRSQTVLEVGYSAEISVKLRNECVGKATVFAQQFGFKYASDIGVQELGSSGASASTTKTLLGGDEWKASLQQRMQEDRQLIESLRSIYGEQHPQIIELEKRIQAAEKELETQDAKARTALAVTAGVDRLTEVHRLAQLKADLAEKLQKYGEQHPQIRELKARIQFVEEYLESLAAAPAESAPPDADDAIKPRVYPMLGPGVLWHIHADGTMTFGGRPTSFDQVENLAARISNPKEVTLLIACEPGVKSSVCDRVGKIALEWRQRYGLNAALINSPPAAPEPAIDAGVHYDDAAGFNCTIYDLDEGHGKEAVDLDTCVTCDLRLPVDEQRTPDQRRAWFKENGSDLLPVEQLAPDRREADAANLDFDLVADYANDQWALGMFMPSVTIVPAEDVKWHEADKQVPQVLEKKEERLRGLVNLEEQGVEFLPLGKDRKPPVRFAFRTAQGTEGLLLVEEFNNEPPRSIGLRWKVTKRAGDDSAGNESPQSPDGFGPVRRLSLHDTSVPANNMFDFDTGKVFSVPSPVEVKDTIDLAEWKASNGIDVSVVGGPIDSGLNYEDMTLDAVPNFVWENPDSDAAKARVRHAVPSFVNGFPQTYYFATRGGATGILRVLDHTKDRLGHTWNLEYRLVLSDGKDHPPATADAVAEVTGALEFRIAATKEEAKSSAASDNKLGWYDAGPWLDQKRYLVTREEGDKIQVLLWKTPDKSMTATKIDDRNWQIISVSVIAEPGKPGRIGVVFDVEGGRRLRELTAGNIDRRLAVLVDGQIIACPIVRSPIGERVEITGNFSQEDLSRLSNALQTGLKPERPK